MTQDSGTATLEQKSKQKQADKSKPKLLPPYAVIVHNDNDHTFDYVIELFQKVFGYSATKGFILAEQIHTEGRAVVWSGAKEVAELKRDQIRTGGPDFYAARTVKYPLGVSIEPMPG